MEVEVLRKTESPDELFCQAARGDYYEGFVGDTDLREVMSGVKWEDYHLEGLADILHKEGSGAHHYVKGTVEGYLDGENALDESIMFEAKKRAFIEKQLFFIVEPHTYKYVSTAQRRKPFFRERQA